MLHKAIPLCIGAYLLGSVPSAYLAGRWLRGIDIRQYGSRNVGGSNTWKNVARWAVVPVGLFDLGKAALPTWLALHRLDLGYSVAVVAGLCAALGHAWSLYLRFTGGRALSCILGTLAVVFPSGALGLLLVMAVTALLQWNPLTAIGLLGLPAFSLALSRPPAVTYGCLAMILLTALKRLEANGEPLPRGPERRAVIWRRLWMDRDIASHEAWVTREPEGAQRDGSSSVSSC